jgi:branched-chain amino acid transport system ATP-binding protein
VSAEPVARAEPLLEVRDVDVQYGGIRALTGVSLDVQAGEVVTLIGANGAGKTTLLRAISRLVPIGGGTIRLAGQDLAKKTTNEIVALGVAHAPEGRRMLARQSVYNNLVLGAYVRRDKAAIQSDIERQFERFPRLKERREQSAGTLSGGEQQMLAIARAMMSRPKLLLLDEPSLGLAPKLVRDIFAIIDELHDGSTTILLVEQNATLALQHADRGYVMEAGEISLSGPAAELVEDDRVRRAYLG